MTWCCNSFRALQLFAVSVTNNLTWNSGKFESYMTFHLPSGLAGDFLLDLAGTDKEHYRMAASYQKPARLLMIFLDQKVVVPNLINAVCNPFKIPSSLWKNPFSKTAVKASPVTNRWHLGATCSHLTGSYRQLEGKINAGKGKGIEVVFSRWCGEQNLPDLGDHRSQKACHLWKSATDALFHLSLPISHFIWNYVCCGTLFLVGTSC